jgi:hypothetical protein
VQAVSVILTNPNLGDAVINAILDNADHTGALGQNMLTWTQHGRLNLHAALDGGGDCAGFWFVCKAHPPVHIRICVAGCNAADRPKDKQDQVWNYYFPLTLTKRR